MKRNIVVAGSVAFLALSAPARAESAWVHASSDRAGTVIDIDLNSVTDEQAILENYRKAWYRLDHTKDRSVNYRITKQLMYFKCAENKSSTMQIVRYSASGRVVYSRSFDYPEWRDVIPDTVGEDMLHMACVVQR